MKQPLYKILASLVQARDNCWKNGNSEWFTRHEERIEELVKEFMPSGSGFDCGTKIDFDRSTGEKLVFFADYHHMDEMGGYDGWTEGAKIVVKPSLSSDFNLKITGIRRKNRIDLDYWYDTFYHALSQEVER